MRNCLKYWSMVLLIWAGVAAADMQMPQEELHERMMRLSAELRCVVCQNQSLADSNAELAINLRAQIAMQLLSGKSESEIIEFLVQRYGEFILYRPTFGTSNWLLWLGPALMLAGGILIYLRSARSVEAQQ